MVCVFTPYLARIFAATEDADDDSSENSKDADSISDDDEDKLIKPKDVKEKKYETVVDWELLNGNKALWLQDPKDIEAEEYTKFYAALSKVRLTMQHYLA
jgi:HSP90 family molecular chaperone